MLVPFKFGARTIMAALLRSIGAQLGRTAATVMLVRTAPHRHAIKKKFSAWVQRNIRDPYEAAYTRRMKDFNGEPKMKTHGDWRCPDCKTANIHDITDFGVVCDNGHTTS